MVAETAGGVSDAALGFPNGADPTRLRFGEGVGSGNLERNDHRPDHRCGGSYPGVRQKSASVPSALPSRLTSGMNSPPRIRWVSAASATP